MLDLQRSEHEHEQEHDYDKEELNFNLASDLTDFLSSACT